MANQPQRQVFPAMMFSGLRGHIFVSVPLLLYVLSSIDGRIVFYVLLFSFQVYVCVLVCLALFAHEEITSSLIIRLLRLFSVLCWGGICFMVYALIGSVVYTRYLQNVPPATKPRTVAVAAAEPGGAAEGMKNHPGPVGSAPATAFHPDSGTHNLTIPWQEKPNGTLSDAARPGGAGIG